MKVQDVARAQSLLDRRNELLGYLKTIKEVKSLKVEIEPTFIVVLTANAAQDLIGNIRKQYLTELDGIEMRLEELGVEPD